MFLQVLVVDSQCQILETLLYQTIDHSSQVDHSRSIRKCSSPITSRCKATANSSSKASSLSRTSVEVAIIKVRASIRGIITTATATSNILEVVCQCLLISNKTPCLNSNNQCPASSLASSAVVASLSVRRRCRPLKCLCRLKRLRPTMLHRVHNLKLANSLHKVSYHRLQASQVKSKLHKAVIHLLLSRARQHSSLKSESVTSLHLRRLVRERRSLLFRSTQSLYFNNSQSTPTGLKITTTFLR